MPHSQAQAHPGWHERHLIRIGKALQLRAAGKTYRAIAGEMGISEKAARNLVKDGFDSYRQSDRGQSERSVILYEITARLEVALSALSCRVKAGDVYAVGVWISINREIAKLYGLYGPNQDQTD